MVLGVNIKEAPALVKTYVAKHNLTFPHVLDSSAVLASELSVPASPTTVLVDRQGKVIGGALGYRNWASPAALQVVESLLK